jgi:hypothetical protein
MDCVDIPSRLIISLGCYPSGLQTPDAKLGTASNSLDPRHGYAHCLILRDDLTLLNANHFVVTYFRKEFHVRWLLS